MSRERSRRQRSNTKQRVRVSPLAVFLSRYSGLILIVFALASPVIIYWAGRAVGTNSNRLADWLPAHLDETVALRQFDQWFGDGQFIVVSWDDCRIDLGAKPDDASGDDPRLERAVANADGARRY